MTQEELQSENERLRATLTFYADVRNWYTVVRYPDDERIWFTEEGSEILQDGGIRARKTLDGIK